MADIVFTDTDGTLIPIVVDATPEEQHRGEAVATELPVEEGVAITDHVRPQRGLLTLQAVISDTPIAPNDELGGSFQSLEIAKGVKAQTYLRDEDEPTRTRTTWEKLTDAMDRALLAVVTTTLATYENMVLLGRETQKTAADGSWIKVQLTFVPIRRVETEFVDAPAPVRPRDQRQRDRGAQSTEEAQPRLRSLAVQGTSGLLEHFGIGGI